MSIRPYSCFDTFLKLSKAERFEGIKLLIQSLDLGEVESFVGLLDYRLAKSTIQRKPEEINEDVVIDHESNCIRPRLKRKSYAKSHKESHVKNGVNQEKDDLKRCTRIKENFIVKSSEKMLFSCGKCGESFSSVNSHSMHIAQFKCNAQIKIAVEHENNKDNFGVINEQTNSSLKKDKVGHIFPCELCPYQAKNKQQLQRHLAYSHEKGSNVNVCPICDKKYFHCHSLKIHIMDHSGIKPVVCTSCGKTFKRKAVLKEHIDFYHKEGDNKICPICGFLATSPRALKIHKLSHSEGKKNCEQCNKYFLNEITLKQHMQLIHSEAAFQFKCKVCNKSFNRKKSLEKHSFIHSKSKDFSCGKCSKSFKSPYTLQKHVKIHEDTNYACNHCDKTFSLSGNLKAHKRIHTGEKPYVCEGCQKAFGQKGNLKTHQLKCSKKNRLKS